MSVKYVLFKLKFPKADPHTPSIAKAVIYARRDATWHRLTETITESLFDSYIDDLITELEQIRQEGRRKFAAWSWRLKSN